MKFRPVGARGAEGAMASPNSGRSVNPIYTRRANYAHHSTTGPHEFSDLPTVLKLRPIILLSIFGGLLPFYETTTFDKNNVLDLVLDYGAWNGSR